MRAIGVDPSLTTLPWALVDAGQRLIQGAPGEPLRSDSSPRLVAVGVFTGPGRGRGRAILEQLTTAIFPPAEVAAVEAMQVYEGSKRKGRPGDLLDLQILAGAAAAALRRSGAIVGVFKPSEWKGQLSKAMHHRLIRQELDLPEKVGFFGAREWSGSGYDVLGAGSVLKSHWKDIWDAAGLALFAIRKARIIQLQHEHAVASSGYAGAPLANQTAGAGVARR